MNEKFTTAENTPNAGRLMTSLRSSGYKNETAIADILDNSIDADAKNIKVYVLEEKGQTTIAVSDDGIGMDFNVLCQALRLGSDTNHEDSSDLGKFGLGLVTASISLTKRIEIYTKKKNSQTFAGILDLDDVIKTNSFEFQRGLATPAHIEVSQEFGLGEQGTVLVLRNCDKLTIRNTKELIDTLSNHFGEIYRYFLRAGLKISINNEPVFIKDPMWVDGILVDQYNEAETTTLLSDEKYPVTLESGAVESIRIKIYHIPEFDKPTNTRLKINQTNQGFYILRNHRQIAKGLKLGRFKVHNALNRVRIEVLFSAELDNQMGINFSKHDINPTQKIIDLLDQCTYNTVETIKNRTDKNSVKKSTEELVDDFISAEKNIKSSAKLLEIASPESTASSITKKKLVSFLTDANPKKTSQTGKQLLSSDIVRFGTSSFTAAGPIIDVEKEGKLTIIIWNIDHPFYQTFVINNSDNKDLLNAVHALVYVIGEAKLQYSTDALRSKLLNDMIITMSSNLRILLG
ncbi:MAG: ATP-binding protein [Patescibacteria group bacterium]